MTKTDAAPATSRNLHLFGPGRKRILSLDGGGVRGAVSIAFLERLEELVEEIEGKPTRLCDWFDLIGGTSTGAIIACALALGFRASDIRKLYETLGPLVFRKRALRVPGLRAVFDRKDLLRELKRFIGDRTLDSDELLTGLCIVSKRLDTGSSWVLTNVPDTQFWDTPADFSFIGNRHYSLASIVRASAAAPHFFDPELIEVAKGAGKGLFIDGALTPHNCPAFQLLLVALLPQFGLSWQTGKENLTVISIGTGSFRPKVAISELNWLRPLGMAVRALTAQISDSQQLVLTLMAWLGESRIPWPINMQLGDLEGTAPGGEPLFRFLRYDVQLEQDWLRDQLGLSLDQAMVTNYRKIDVAKNISALYQLGRLAAEKQMLATHLSAEVRT
jgi:uncharacterized protein